MLSILDIYAQAFYWQVFAPAPRWHTETTVLNRSGDEGLQRTGEIGLKRPPARVPSSSGASTRDEGAGVSAPAPRWRRGIDVTV